MNLRLCWLFFLMPLLPGFGAARLATQNVVLVTTDGLRWQEVFRGAEEALMDRRGGVRNPEALKKLFLRSTPSERREALLPFFWNVLARQGQLFGNLDQESPVRVSNGLNFSYPGYHEMLAGYVDRSIDSNSKRNNPNRTVLEWLQQKPAFQGKVAAFCTWDVFPYILHVERSGLVMQSSWEPPPFRKQTPRAALLTDLIRDTTPIWDMMTLDSLMFYSTLEYLEQERPRVVFLSFGETDEWAHGGRYDLYLQSAHLFDRYLAKLWAFLQGHRFYRGKTTVIVTTDHGRGTGPSEWKDHGQKIAGAEEMWLAVLGPDTPALGERRRTPVVTQSQVAATLAAALGYDYPAAEPKAAPPIPGVLEPRAR